MTSRLCSSIQRQSRTASYPGRACEQGQRKLTPNTRLPCALSPRFICGRGINLTKSPRRIDVYLIRPNQKVARAEAALATLASLMIWSGPLKLTPNFFNHPVPQEHFHLHLLNQVVPLGHGEETLHLPLTDFRIQL